MPCTEVAILRLQNASTRESLEALPALRECVETILQQPGCTSLTWDVLHEDPKALVWIVDWETIEDHTVRFIKSDAYKAFQQAFATFLTAKEEQRVQFFHHFNFTPTPAHIYSPDHPTLELFCIALGHYSEYERFMTIFEPILELHRQHDLKFAYSQAMEEGCKSKLMFVVAWESVDAHYAAKRDPQFQKAITQARDMWAKVELFGHIKPGLATQTGESQA